MKMVEISVDISDGRIAKIEGQDLYQVNVKMWDIGGDSCGSYTTFVYGNQKDIEDHFKETHAREYRCSVTLKSRTIDPIMPEDGKNARRKKAERLGIDITDLM